MAAAVPERSLVRLALNNCSSLSDTGIQAAYVVQDEGVVIANFQTLMALISSSCESSADGSNRCVAGTALCWMQEVPGVCLPVQVSGMNPCDFGVTLHCLFDLALQRCRDFRVRMFLQEEMFQLLTMITLRQDFRDKGGLANLKREIKALEHDDQMLLNIGTGDHCIYMGVSNTASGYQLFFYNLSYGACGDRFPSGYIYKVADLSWHDLKKRLEQLRHIAGSGKGVAELKTVYTNLYRGAKPYLESAIVEPPQESTKNCSWKSYTLYLRQRCMEAGVDYFALRQLLDNVLADFRAEVDEDPERNAYNLLVSATQQARHESAYKGLEPCAAIPAEHRYDPGTGCGAGDVRVSLSERAKPGRGAFAFVPSQRDVQAVSMAIGEVSMFKGVDKVLTGLVVVGAVAGLALVFVGLLNSADKPPMPKTMIRKNFGSEHGPAP